MPITTKVVSSNPVDGGVYSMQYYVIPGEDPGFVVRGGVSRRAVWGPHAVPSGSRAEPPPGSSGGLRNYRHLFERQF